MNHSSPLPASTPEAQGISSAAISAFVDAIHANDIELMHSFELLVATVSALPKAGGRPMRRNIRTCSFR